MLFYFILYLHFKSSLHFPSPYFPEPFAVQLDVWSLYFVCFFSRESFFPKDKCIFLVISIFVKRCSLFLFMYWLYTCIVQWENILVSQSTRAIYDFFTHFYYFFLWSKVMLTWILSCCVTFIKKKKNHLEYAQVLTLYVEHTTLGRQLFFLFCYKTASQDQNSQKLFYHPCLLCIFV